MTLVCQTCGLAFSDYQIIDGKRRHLHGRRQCLQCLPFKPRRSPRFYHARPPRMLVCQLCGREFSSCSPFGEHNTSKRPIGRGPEADVARRKRRNESSYRCQRRRRVDRKQRLVDLRGGRCEDCGYDVSIAALEFHHRDSKTKEFGLGNFNGSWERLVAEAAKCDLLCANCHRRRHNYQGTVAARGKKARAIELMGGTCGGCSGVVPDSLFEFHHWDAREKKFGISRDGLSRPWEAIAEELVKCVMLCANCHREVHAGARALERQSSVTLGTAGIGEAAAA